MNLTLLIVFGVILVPLIIILWAFAIFIVVDIWRFFSMNEYSVLNQIKIYYSRSIAAESEEDANGKNLMLNNFITHELVKYFSEKFPPGGTGTYSIYSQQIGEVDKRC